MDKEYELKEENADELLSLAEYIDHFNVHYKLLIQRYKRFKEVNNISNRDIDVITYLDMIVVQIRAMCIESPSLKNNYTAQNLLRKVGEDELAAKIDKMLAEPFIPESDFTIRTAIKTLADGFICHYDNFEFPKNDGWYLANTIERRLISLYDTSNLDYIMRVLIDCIGEGLSVNLK